MSYRFPALDRGHAPRRRRDRHRRRLPRWAIAAGVAGALAVAVLGILLAIGLWPHAKDLYLAASTAVLPEAWHATWESLPDLVHVGLALLGVLGGIAAIAAVGELFD